MIHWKDRFRAVVSVYLILLNEQGQVLLLKRQNTGYKDNEFGLPAGHVDGEEELTQAMIREAREEVGLNLQSENLELGHVMHRHCGDHECVDFFFLCQRWEGTPTNCEVEKCSELTWFPLEALPESTIDYYKQAFDHIREGQVYSAFGWK
ncbi:NUDIX domain-containing protein [Candidatus Uhrbacteria bacterium]|nr:NUDIX domain-containing protein [Candidatus Uhrbacteria bacterium]